MLPIQIRRRICEADMLLACRLFLNRSIFPPFLLLLLLLGFAGLVRGVVLALLEKYPLRPALPFLFHLF